MYVSRTDIQSDSFEDLAIPLFDQLYNFAHWLTRNRDEAEDLVQETYVNNFRQRVERSIATKPRSSFAVRWMFAAALSILVVASLLATYLGVQRSRRDQGYGEIADLHVAALASSSRVDVVSSDRHTVKPWFQGKIPFTFDLPELQNSEFSLLGGPHAVP